mmetsp:Transcript_19176/g.54442  ORF Transcript_19176/g.54442 Transcript_19176/m.54442 type:complete len:114 (-) Transcript_19176:1582-1923(-)
MEWWREQCHRDRPGRRRHRTGRCLEEGKRLNPSSRNVCLWRAATLKSIEIGLAGGRCKFNWTNYDPRTGTICHMLSTNEYNKQACSPLTYTQEHSIRKKIMHTRHSTTLFGGH